MKRKLAKTLAWGATSAMALLAPGACSDDYDDSQAWKQLDALQKELAAVGEQLADLQGQADAMHALLTGGSITMVADAPGGGKTISYVGADNVERQVVVATMGQMTDADIIGVKLDNGVYYWTYTRRGVTNYLLDQYDNRIPLTGTTPKIEVNAEGYWTVNGVAIRDADGNPVKSEAVAAPLITDAAINADGTATLTLASGEKIAVSAFTLFNLRLYRDGQEVASPIAVAEGAASLALHYEIVGEKASQALLLVTRADEGIDYALDSSSRTLTLTLAAGFEQGVVMLMLYDAADNVLIKPVAVALPTPENAGIADAQGLLNFLAAVTAGGSLREFTNPDGEVVLLADIDMAGQPITAGGGGPVASNTTAANKAVSYTVADNTFNGILNGNGHTISNLAITYDLGDGSVAHGLLTALGPDGVVKNLTVAGSVRVAGNAPQGAAVGGLVGVCEGTLANCTSRLDIAFAGDDAANTSVRIGGLAGVLSAGKIGDGTPGGGCVNAGNLTCGAIVNANSGANAGFHQGGIAGYVEKSGAIAYCTNAGSLSAPSGRGGGIAGTLASGTIDYCVNNGIVQDDVDGVFAANASRYNVKRMGGLVGGSGSCTVTGCTNNGNVFSQNGCRTGGFIGHNGGFVVDCTNNGIILSDYQEIGSNKHGAGWACGYSGSATAEPYNVSNCHIGGKVGDYTAYGSNPEATPAATYSNAVVHGAFYPAANGLTNRDAEFYDWTVTDSREVAAGVSYTQYTFTNLVERVHVLEVDLTNQGLTIETSMADDLCPNPNGNEYHNNGKNLRETLSENVARKRGEGRNIVAGINTGFFDSHFGFPRGVHIEDGEAVFINNPTVRSNLSNHIWGFAYYRDRSVRFDNRKFAGAVRVAGVEYSYHSVNDTIVFLSETPSYDANVYTHRWVKAPHEGMSNPVGAAALFIVAKGSAPITVNTGYQEATVTAIVDGRSAQVEPPYVSEKGEWVLQVTGDKAATLANAVAVGDKIEIKATLTVGACTDPIDVYNASMYYYVQNGQYAPPSSSTVAETIYQTTNIGANADRTKLYLFIIDGKVTYRGLDFYEAARVAQKLGISDVVRVDGGGSSTMWLLDEQGGSLVNNITDSNGERSCMNYLHVRVK